MADPKTTDRRDVIRRLRINGESYATIGKHVGLSGEMVRKIILGHPYDRGFEAGMQNASRIHIARAEARIAEIENRLDELVHEASCIQGLLAEDESNG